MQKILSGYRSDDIYKKCPNAPCIFGIIIKRCHMINIRKEGRQHPNGGHQTITYKKKDPTVYPK